MQTLLINGASTIQEISKRTNITSEEIISTADDLLVQGKISVLSLRTKGVELVDAEKLATKSINPRNDLLISSNEWNRIQQETLHALDNYHQSHPLRRGMSREELKSRITSKLHIQSSVYEYIQSHMVQEGSISETGPLVYLPGHEIRFTEDQEELVAKLMSKFDAFPFSPPSVKECQAQVGEKIFAALIDLGFLICVSSEVVFRVKDYNLMVTELKKLFEEKSTLSAGEVRDHFQTSRKYALAFLEHLDSEGITVRQGDIRKLKPGIQ